MTSDRNFYLTVIGTLFLLLVSGAVIFLTRDDRNLVDPDEVCREAVESIGRITPLGRDYYYELCRYDGPMSIAQRYVMTLVDREAKLAETEEETIARVRREWTALGGQLCRLQREHKEEVMETIPVFQGGTGVLSVDGVGSFPVPVAETVQITPGGSDHLNVPGSILIGGAGQVPYWANVKLVAQEPGPHVPWEPLEEEVITAHVVQGGFLGYVGADPPVPEEPLAEVRWPWPNRTMLDYPFAIDPNWVETLEIILRISVLMAKDVICGSIFIGFMCLKNFLVWFLNLVEDMIFIVYRS